MDTYLRRVVYNTSITLQGTFLLGNWVSCSKNVLNINLYVWNATKSTIGLHNGENIMIKHNPMNKTNSQGKTKHRCNKAVHIQLGLSPIYSAVKKAYTNKLRGCAFKRVISLRLDLAALWSKSFLIKVLLRLSLSYLCDKIFLCDLLNK